MSEIKVNTQLLGLKDINLHVDDYGGSGRPVILIHGWPLSGASWKYQLSALNEAGFRVITYDRRGFGRSDKPVTGYSYKTLAQDLSGIIEALNLRDVTLVGFSMGGGEVAQYIADFGESRLHSVVFAGAITPMMMNLPNNPEGPLDKTKAAAMTLSLTTDSDAFYKDFIKQFFSPNANGTMLVSDAQYQETLVLCKQASKLAALEAMQAFALADFREDLKKISVPTLVIHGDADGTVSFEGSGARTHQAIKHSQLHIIEGAPHGFNVSHAEKFNTALISFLEGNTVAELARQHKVVG